MHIWALSLEKFFKSEKKSNSLLILALYKLEGYKTVELTEEQKQRRQEKAQKRRQQANEKMENDKNQTVHKLLKKQDSKNKRAFKARGGKRSNIPRILYRNTQDRISIHLPGEVSFPLVAQTATLYPEAQLCGVDGCYNKKTSVCSKTGVAVCGLQCYKKNLALHASKMATCAEAANAELMSGPGPVNSVELAV
ncbi:ino80 complex subunit b [Plakobranchus ocellatus]|uniref:Ino80 complex subunit b n=1 Tax=Plakobranchus ocellatus TaxID=259542 RepID=A0AAV4DAS9_9GAST|nr:ino80 complex subunit b [Plakobranchus ocellatus]